MGAFANFFSRQWAPSGWSLETWDGETNLTSWQRWRVVLVIYAWIAIIIFLALQVTFGLDLFGFRIGKSCHALVLVSYFSEVTALLLVYALPVVAGFSMMETLGNHCPFVDEVLEFKTARLPWPLPR